MAAKTIHVNENSVENFEILLFWICSFGARCGRLRRPTLHENIPTESHFLLAYFLCMPRVMQWRRQGEWARPRSSPCPRIPHSNVWGIKNLCMNALFMYRFGYQVPLSLYSLIGGTKLHIFSKLQYTAIRRGTTMIVSPLYSLRFPHRSSFHPIILRNSLQIWIYFFPFYGASKQG